MKTVNESQALNVEDNKPSNNAGFNDVARNLWKDNLGFNIFTVDGLLTDEAKDFVKEHGIKRKSFDETWGDAILTYAEHYELGYQVPKAQVRRSSVKFSGSMILLAYMEAQESGRDYRESKDNAPFEDGIDLIEELTLKSYQ